MKLTIWQFAYFSVIAAASLNAATPPEEVAAQAPAARAILDKWQAEQPEQGDRFVHLVYWTPSDRDPAPRYRERLSKIFVDVREFYAREMERNGFGRRTIKLVQETDGLSKIHLVRGAQPYAHYNVDSGYEIRGECLPVLREAGLDAGKETIVIFCNMANWDEEKRTMSQNSPYYASGTSWSGTAWQVDSPLLDLDLLDDREPLLQDKQYGNISVGRYNSIFIGGIVHELGHALSMPHNRERKDQRELWGTALMGSGNRTYGEDLRGEGKGTFLTLGEAMRLASHPMFSGSVKGFQGKPNVKLDDVKISPNGKTFTFSARVTADPPVYGIIGYTDPAGGSDYDATTCTAVPDADGRFTLDCYALASGKPGVLRVVALQANGAKHANASSGSEAKFPYFVNADGTIDLTASLAREQLAVLINSVNEGNSAAAKAELQRLEKYTSDDRIIAVARELLSTIDTTIGLSPAIAEGDRLALSTAATKDVSVGYGKPVANRLPGADPLLMAGSRLYAQGLYAHAPARHEWELGGKWSRVTGNAGVAEGRRGSVVFSIAADGREVWKSKLLKEGETASYDLPIKERAATRIQSFRRRRRQRIGLGALVGTDPDKVTISQPVEYHAFGAITASAPSAN
jgi:NPCBM/NEW2 domain